MEKLLAPSVVGQLVQAITAIIVAVITYIIGPIITRLLQLDNSWLSSLIRAVMAGITAAITFVVIGLIIGWLFHPSVELTSLSPGQQIKTDLDPKGGVWVWVDGNSSRVGSGSRLSLYVLVHPAEPPAGDWWKQEDAVIESNGVWRTKVHLGGVENTPKVGDKFDIVAVAAPHTKRESFKPLSAIHPEAQSQTVQVSIGSIKVKE